MIPPCQGQWLESGKSLKDQDNAARFALREWQGFNDFTLRIRPGTPTLEPVLQFSGSTHYIELRTVYRRTVHAVSQGPQALRIFFVIRTYCPYFFLTNSATYRYRSVWQLISLTSLPPFLNDL